MAKNRFYRSVLMGCLGAVLLAGCSSAKTADYQSLQQQAVASSTQSSTQKEDRKIDFKALQKANPDIIAWISIPGAGIEYPILQADESEPDDFYLGRDYQLNQVASGSVYIEKYNNKNFSDPLTVVYGHTIIDGNTELEPMFTELHRYEDNSFFKDNPTFTITTPEKTLTYDIFSAVNFDDRYILGNYQFRDPDDLKSFATELATTIDGNTLDGFVAEGDEQIVVLSTCIAGQPDRRFLVSGVLSES